MAPAGLGIRRRRHRRRLLPRGFGIVRAQRIGFHARLHRRHLGRLLREGDVVGVERWGELGVRDGAP